MTDFTLALQGNLQKVLDDRAKHVLRALRAGTEASVDIAKRKMRSDVLASGMGSKLAFTMRGDVYPLRGLTWNPVGLVYSNAPKITGMHATGGTISAKAGAMIVPLKDGPADGLRRRRGETAIEAFERRYGKLTYVKRPGKSPLLVAKLRASEAGKFTKVRALKPLKRKQGPRVNFDRVQSVPVFQLLRNVHMKKKLNTRAILEKAKRRHLPRLAHALQAEMKLSERDTQIKGRR